VQEAGIDCDAARLRAEAMVTYGKRRQRGT